MNGMNLYTLLYDARNKDWVVVSNIFYFHPDLGKISNLTNIFQRGWTHQLEDESLLIHEICNFQRRFVTQERFGNQPPRLAAASLNFSRCNLDDEAVRFVRYDVSETTVCQNVWFLQLKVLF